MYVWFLELRLDKYIPGTIIGPSLRDVFTLVRIEDSVVSNLNHVLGIACLIQFWVLHSLVSMISSYMDPSSDSRSLT